MSYRETDIVHEAGRFWVLRNAQHQRYTVLASGSVCSESDSHYAFTDDGKSIAIARANYLARREAQRKAD